MSSSRRHPAVLSRRSCLRLALGATTGIARADELRQLRPVDESDRDPQLASLLNRMRGIAGQRNPRQLQSLMLPTFRVEFDAGKGPSAFWRHWRPAASESPVWVLLQKLLQLGGTFYSDSLFAIPYVYTKFPTDLDPLTHVVALKPDVSLFERPESSSRIVGKLDYSIIPTPASQNTPASLLAERFIEVLHPEFGEVFANSSDVYCPAGHRAFFEERRGVWQWISLAEATLADPPELLRQPSRR